MQLIFPRESQSKKKVPNTRVRPPLIITVESCRNHIKKLCTQIRTWHVQPKAFDCLTFFSSSQYLGNTWSPKIHGPPIQSNPQSLTYKNLTCKQFLAVRSGTEMIDGSHLKKKVKSNPILLPRPHQKNLDPQSDTHKLIRAKWRCLFTCRVWILMDVCVTSMMLTRILWWSRP